MSEPTIEQRLAALEKQVAELRRDRRDGRAWIDKLVGAFENDPMHEEAARLGREYRESLRPKPRTKKNKTK